MRNVSLSEDSSAASAHLHHRVKTRKGCWSEYLMAMVLMIKLPGAEAVAVLLLPYDENIAKAISDPRVECFCQSNC